MTSDFRYRLVRNTVAVGLTAVLLAGFLMRFPRVDDILGQTARNLFFHVPMWFTLMAAMAVSAWHAFKYLRTKDPVRDLRSAEAARVGLFFGLLGITTGMVWARFTWYEGTGLWWNNDPKQLMAAVQLLVYAGYFVLRSTLDDPVRRARLSAAYNLFAATCVPFLLYVLPRQMASLHPGAEGNPAFSQVTHWTMRLVLYPSFLLFIGLFWVLYTQRVRLVLLQRRLHPEPEL
ncbi:MAG TPA: cytochrome c biogenesis protein CcsA [Rhodothermales bacterium]|nr:cytochrome c biogenesis protein CcsA [Rhodothermales bacterium]